MATMWTRLVQLPVRRWDDELEPTPGRLRITFGAMLGFSLRIS